MFRKGANFTPEIIQGAKDKAYLKAEVREHGYCIKPQTMTLLDGPRRLCRRIRCRSEEQLHDWPEYPDRYECHT